MSLESRYNSAAAETNAGKAKAIQTSNAPVTNFFDGVGRNQNNTAPDEYQTEFTPNTQGDFRYDAGGKVPGKYSLSRWLPIGVNKSDALLTNNKFTSLILGDVRNAANRLIHRFKPSDTFANSSSLSAFAKTKAK